MDWKQTLASVAPTIATALGGPMAGVAAQMAVKVLGVDVPPEDAEMALQLQVEQADPSTLVKLREIDAKFKREMKQLDVDIYTLDVKDRTSARGLAADRGMLPQAVLSGIFVTGFVLVLYYLFAGNTTVADNMMQPAMYVLGILSAGIVQILNFWFGSSSGSKQKTVEISGKK